MNFSMKDDLLRQRRNLMAISVALIIFYSGGGSFEKGSFLGGLASLEYPCVIEVALWIGMVYFAWRFWVFGGKRIWLAIPHRYYEQIIIDPLFQKHAKIIFKESARQSFSDNPSYEKYCQHVDVAGQIIVTRGLFNLTLNIPGRDDAKAAMPFSKYADIPLRAAFKTIFSTEVVSDYLLPYLLALAAIVVAINM